jgi:hypothetical protein
VRTSGVRVWNFEESRSKCRVADRIRRRVVRRGHRIVFRPTEVDAILRNGVSNILVLYAPQRWVARHVLLHFTTGVHSELIDGGSVLVASGGSVRAISIHVSSRGPRKEEVEETIRECDLRLAVAAEVPGVGMFVSCRDGQNVGNKGEWPLSLLAGPQCHRALIAAQSYGRLSVQPELFVRVLPVHDIAHVEPRTIRPAAAIVGARQLLVACQLAFDDRIVLILRPRPLG